MAGYAATGRIVKAHPRFVGRATSRVAGPGFAVADTDPCRVETVLTEPRPLDVRLSDGLAQAREAWAQTTFFLFDPNSWR